MPLEPSKIVLVNDRFMQTPHVSSGYCRTKTNIYQIRKSGENFFFFFFLREKYIELENKNFIFVAGQLSPSEYQCKQ